MQIKEELNKSRLNVAVQTATREVNIADFSVFNSTWQISTKDNNVWSIFVTLGYFFLDSKGKNTETNFPYRLWIKFDDDSTSIDSLKLLYLNSYA